MATVLRVKRLLSEDPANALVLRKRLKGNDSDNREEDAKYFTFIGTVKDGNEQIEKEIISKACTAHSNLPKYSSWREKIVGQDIKSHRAKSTARRRTAQRETSQENRLKLVNRLRSVNTDETTDDNLDLDGEVKHLYTLYDVTEDEALQKDTLKEVSSKDVITCNGIPLVQVKPTNSTAYDLYYTSDNFTEESFADHIISIEKCLFKEEGVELLAEDDCNSNDGDDEDSNDENNWRNDYPDEDDDFEKDLDYYRDYDDDEEEIMNMFESCNLCTDDDYDSDDSFDLAREPRCRSALDSEQFKLKIEKEQEEMSNSE